MSLNLVNEFDLSPWLQTIAPAGFISTQSYKDRDFVTANINPVADVVVYSWLKRNIRAYLERHVGMGFLERVDDMPELSQSVLESAAAGNPPYRFNADRIPDNMTNELKSVCKMARFRVIGHIRKLTAEPEFNFDIKTVVLAVGDFTKFADMARSPLPAAPARDFQMD